MRVVDVALFYGERSGGIRTYLDNKIAWASATSGIEHHVIVPGPRRVHEGGRHELPSLRIAAANGYRLPLGVRALNDTLRALRPDVVLLHDPFWGPLNVCQVSHEMGARVVAVHHGSSALDAAGMPGPDAPWRAGFRRWMHHAYREVDAVMSAVDPREDSGRDVSIPLRFGLHPAFTPPAEPEPRGDHVLYVGRIAREKGVFELVRAAARAPEPWPLRLVGTGPALDRVRTLAAELEMGKRLQLRPYIRDPERLAQTYRRARVVVMPGEHETFGLVGFEAAASGAATVACETAPSARIAGPLMRTFAPGDVDGLLSAIEEARRAEPDRGAAASLARHMTWNRALDAELADLREFVR
ncbi:MAG: glycosyltransferase [Solirubrobacteraceae bacterium]|nr:glycosyltransferase [Solirubrobacteraceae bacterium]